MRATEAIGMLCALALLMACAKEQVLPPDFDPPYTPPLPPGVTMIPVPAGNEFTVARVSLGKALFFDQRLSMGNGLSCASCHFPGNAFSDTTAFSTGANGLLGERNAPTLADLAWQTAFFHDGGIPTLEQQVLAPVHDEREMDSNINLAAQLLREDARYEAWSRLGYDRSLDAFVVTRALACYERTLVSGWSRYDRYLYEGDSTALTAQEREGLDLFIAVGCAQCHAGRLLTDHSYRNVGSETDLVGDPGRQRITLDPDDRGKFKVPTLRNVALTAPYMHDGRFATLAEVVQHFNGGGDPVQHQDALMQPLGLGATQQAAIIAFMHSLTDQRPLDQLP